MSTEGVQKTWRLEWRGVGLGGQMMVGKSDKNVLAETLKELIKILFLKWNFRV